MAATAMPACDQASMRITNLYRAYRDRFDAKETPVDVLTDMMSDLMHLADAFGSDGPSVVARRAPLSRRGGGGTVHSLPYSSRTASGSPP